MLFCRIGLRYLCGTQLIYRYVALLQVGVAISNCSLKFEGKFAIETAKKVFEIALKLLVIGWRGINLTTQ